MTDRAQSMLIGVDGGGSRCRIALADATGRIRARVEAGSANIASDFDAAHAVIAGALAAALAEAGIDPGGAHHIHLGLAGANAPGAALRLRTALALQFPAAHLVVDDDRKTAVVAALKGGDGAVASMGTGSFLCRMSQGVLRGLGGWGLALGDDGSGAWLGRQAMQRAALGLDRLLPSSPMLRQVTAETGGDRAGMIAFSLRAGAAEYASLARLIVAHAQSGDAEALRLMTLGAQYIRDGLAVLGHAPGQDLYLLGGVGPHYAAHLPDYRCRTARLPAVSGALILAAQAAGLDVAGKSWA